MVEITKVDEDNLIVKNHDNTEMKLVKEFVAKKLD
jgi:preprotein translocase subunit YajC